MTARKVIITRSREGNEELSSRLKRSGLDPVAVDTISFGPPHDWSRVDSLLRRLGFFDWVVFTSATGVRFFGERMRELSLKLPWGGKPRVAAVGPATSSRLTSLGIEPPFVPSSYLAKALADELPFENGSKVLLLRADIADRFLAERLQQRGFLVEEAPIYTTTMPSRQNAEIGGASLVVFASPSAVRGLCSQVQEDTLETLRDSKAVCIGPVTEAAARENGFRHTVIPKSYTLDAVVAEVVRLSEKNE